MSIKTGFPFTLISICERRERKAGSEEQTQQIGCPCTKAKLFQISATQIARKEEGPRDDFDAHLLMFSAHGILFPYKQGSGIKGPKLK